MNTGYINKLTSKEAQQHEENRDGTYCVLRHGGVLLRNGVSTKTLEGADAKAFIARVRDKGDGFVKATVKSYWEGGEK